jgi:hypothetical protein
VTSIGWAQLGWGELAAFEDIATAGSSAANAAVFLGRASHSRGPRRLAALLLAGLFASLSIGAAGELLPGAPPALDVLLGMPVLIADLAVTAVLAMGARR